MTKQAVTTEKTQDETTLPAPRSNRPITLGHRLEYGLVQGLIFMLRAIGIDAASWVAGQFTRNIGPLIKPISKRAVQNLKIAYPDWDDQQIKKTIKDIWENLGRTTAEMAHLDCFDPTRKDGRLTIETPEIFQEAFKSEKPVIYVSGHFANWENLAIALHCYEQKAGIVYRAANNPLVDGLIIKRRARVMDHIQIPKGKRGARALVDTLGKGMSLAMLIDQKLNDGIEAPFFGKPAMSAPTPARLALKYDIPIIPVWIRRENGAHFTLGAHQPIYLDQSKNADAEILRVTTQLNEILASDISKAPGQWLWLHRRWPKEIYR